MQRDYRTVKNRGLGVLVGLIGLALVLSACAGTAQSTAAPTLSPSSTPDELSTLIAMQQRATRVPTATPWPTYTPTFTPSATFTASATPTVSPTFTPSATATLGPASVLAAPTAVPTNTPRSTQVVLQSMVTTPASGASFEQSGEIQDHYWFARPFPRDPTNTIHDFASRSYSYGTTGGDQFATHHGVDIQNQQGTPILAVANGWVVYAGDDSQVMFGPENNFYGNLVVIEHDMVAANGQPVYTLYGHMWRVEVQTGQRVEQLQKIGEVGSTGIALGAHLHFEVRIGNPYDYDSTYNPDLWLRPWPVYGTLAGRITDSSGHRMYDVPITIQRPGNPDRQTYSYADDTVNPDLYYGEYFTYGDLPAGGYQVIVRIHGVLRYKGNVTVEDGKTSWLDIVLN
jgi:murein DD-endopeptidase MepM/ murein hydrolase activator NlpD